MGKRPSTDLCISPDTIQQMVHIVRGQRVMLDFDLAKLYGVSVDYLLGNDQPDGEPEGEPAEDKSSANRRALHEIIDKFSDEDIPDVINHLKALEIVCQHKKETK